MRNLIGLCAALAALPAGAQDTKLACFAAGPDPARRIAACTATLDDMTLPPATHALALMARAEAFLAKGDAVKALADTNTALLLNPHDASSLLARGKLRDALGGPGAPEKAEEDYSSALKQDAGLAEAYARRGKLRLARGAHDEALKDLGEARRLNPGDAETQALFAAAQLKSGGTGDAIAAFTATLDATPGDPAALRGRATAYAQRGLLKEAIADFTSALVANTSDLAAREGRAVAFMQAGNFNAAIADFTALSALKPDDPAPFFFRATALLQIGEASAADEDFGFFLKAHPKDEEALLGRALARQMLANHAGAEADLSVVLAGAPDAALPLAMRGFIRVMLAKWPEAAQDLARAAGLPNAPPEVALWRFIAESRAGLAAAPALAAAAKALPPSAWPSPVMQYFLGALSGDQVLDAAEREPALAQMRLCEAYYYLGEAASLLGDSESAQKMLTAAVGTCLRRHTEYAGAKAALARLASGSQSPPPVR